MWCQENNLSLNISKTNELIVNYMISSFKSFKFLGVQITKELTWSLHTNTVLPLRRLKRFGRGLQILKKFYSCTIESILTGCITTLYGNCLASDRKVLRMALPSRTPIPGDVRRRPYKLTKIPTTQVIDCSLCYSTACGTDTPSLEPTGP